MELELLFSDADAVIWRLEGNTCKPIPDIPTKQKWSHGENCGDRSLVVTGGLYKTEDTFKYSDNTWTRLPRLLDPRFRHSSIYHKGFLYVIGGCRYCYELKLVEKFDFTAQRWLRVRSVPWRCPHPRAAIANERLFVFGVKKGGMYVLNDDDSEWTREAEIPFDHDNASIAVLNDKIYVVSKKNFYCYDPENKSWTKLSSPLFKRMNSGCIVLNQKIVAIGGYDCNKIEEYNAKIDEWKMWELKVPVKTGIGFTCAI
jgi:hypothetical protein